MKLNTRVIITIVISVLAVLLIFLFFFFYHNNEEDSIYETPESFDINRLYTPNDIKFLDEDPIWLVFKHKGDTIDTNYTENLKFEDELYEIVFDYLEEDVIINSGDYIFLEGFYNPEETFLFFATLIEKITEKNYTNLLSRRLPSVEIKIIDKEVDISHGCQNIGVMVNIKNVGEKNLDYTKTQADNTEYVFMAIIDNEISVLYPDMGFDYEEVTIHGFDDFGVIEPGEEIIARFGLGGKVEFIYDSETEERIGKNGVPNLFCFEKSSGPFTSLLRIDFGAIDLKDLDWNLNSQYDFQNKSSSNTIPVNISNCECELAFESLPKPL